MKTLGHQSVCLFLHSSLEPAASMKNVKVNILFYKIFLLFIKVLHTEGA